jgi:hypothetical protein
VFILSELENHGNVLSGCPASNPRLIKKRARQAYISDADKITSRNSCRWSVNFWKVETYLHKKRKCISKGEQVKHIFQTISLRFCICICLDVLFYAEPIKKNRSYSILTTLCVTWYQVTWICQRRLITYVLEKRIFSNYWKPHIDNVFAISTTHFLCTCVHY